MIGLVRVEATRFRSRRAVVLLLLIAAVLAAVIAGATAWDTRPVSDADIAAAEAQAAEEAQQPYVAEELERCEADPEQWGGPDFTADQCEEAVTPQAEWFLFRSALDLGSQREGAALAATMVLVGIAVVVGATFAGADWGSGSMSNQLLFQARRGRVWVVKGLVVALGMMLATAVVLVALWAFLHAVATARDLPGLSGELLALVRGDVLRGALTAGAAALGGYALSMLARSTVATVATLFVLSVAGEILVSLLPVAGRMRFSPGSNLVAVLADGTQVYDETVACTGLDQECGFLSISLGHGVLYLGAVVALVALASWASFRRRDVP